VPAPARSRTLSTGCHTNTVSPTIPATFDLNPAFLAARLRNFFLYYQWLNP
jgi:hypothetical protein